MTRLTCLEQKWNSSFQLLAPRGNIYILNLDSTNADIVQLSTGCNTFHFHCYFNHNRLGNRKTNNCTSNSEQAGRSAVYFRKNEHCPAKLRVYLEEWENLRLEMQMGEMTKSLWTSAWQWQKKKKLAKVYTTLSVASRVLRGHMGYFIHSSQARAVNQSVCTVTMRTIIYPLFTVWRT